MIKQPKMLVVTIVALTLCVNSQSQAGIIIFGGSSIGGGSGSTDGNGMANAMGGTGPWNWSADNGNPGFKYVSDGKSGFNQIRAVVGTAPGTSGIRWNTYDWTVNIWTESGYLASAAPIRTVSLGNTPSNWSGFQTVSPTLTIPNTTPFGAPGGNAPAGTRSYEMVFDLSGQSSLQNLAAGNYIVTFSSRNFGGDGFPGMGISLNGIGPEAYYSRTSTGVAPGPVFPRLGVSSNFRWGMELSIENDFANGFFDSGLSGWNTQGPGQVDLIEVDGNKLVQFTAGSPASLSQWLITENAPMNLSFDLFSLQNSGNMSLFLGTDLLGTYDSSLFLNDWNTFNLDLSNPLYWGRHDELKFTWDGLSGDRAYLDNVSYSAASAVPEPSSFILFAVGSAALLWRKRYRHTRRIEKQAC